MLKMMGGFEAGKGLGKANQGILNPVEAVVTKKDNIVLGQGVFEDKKVIASVESIGDLSITDPEERLRVDQQQRR
jgi:hypothetical protein